ncbi:hypothetical protein NQ318_003237 [Aromia moschata]|uniref:GPI mannosyltransferase 2 n=1 Tax=Aromia moschata TaxID=1265417 RepID=A0AAV8YRC1_9CUCU|nr:hypothetical protein NQ318_003237 [Aromia moschata]
MIQNEQSSKNFQQMDSGRLQIIAFYSRVFILILQYLSNILIPDHDADAFLYPKDNSGNTIFDKCIDHLFGGLVRWDAQYFMHVARYGYTYEKTLAFFPLYPLCVRLIAFVILSVVLLLPFVAFQVYCYIKFCTNFETNLPYNIEIDAQKNNYILPGEFSKHNQTWCYSKLPLAYSYVQNHYWNVGFLKYYEVQQIPNFLLAAPILCFVFKYCLEHLKLHFTTKFKDLFTFDRLSKKTKLTDPFHGQHLHVFVIHALFLSVFCTLCIHIQVTTRLLCSATPLFYWSCASYLKSNSLNNFKMFRLDQSLGERFIKLYYIIPVAQKIYVGESLQQWPCKNSGRFHALFLFIKSSGYHPLQRGPSNILRLLTGSILEV